jgi:hypothetical protein
MLRELARRMYRRVSVGRVQRRQQAALRQQAAKQQRDQQEGKPS